MFNNESPTQSPILNLEQSPEISKGLTGITVANTSVSTVGLKDIGLTYRGYSILDLLTTEFEVVSFLLITGDLPNKKQLSIFKENVASARLLSHEIKSLLKVIPHETHPMDVIRTAISLGSTKLKAKGVRDNKESTLQTSLEVISFYWGFMPSCVGFWYSYKNGGREIDTYYDANTNIAEHFLRVTSIYQSDPSSQEINALNMTLVCYAEHDLNASTFVARVASANHCDIGACLIAAIGVLKGKKHGGANEAALLLINKFDSQTSAREGINAMIANRTIIMGFGHAVYKEGDPRHKFMKELARELSLEGSSAHPSPERFAIADEIEKTVYESKKLSPNVDFFAALVYDQMLIPKSLFTVIFALGRLAGWTAHILEQKTTAGPIVIPKCIYNGEKYRPLPFNINAI